MRTKLLLTILIVILLAVYCLWGTDYRKQRQENEALAAQITEAIHTLSQMPGPNDNLERQLAAAQASLDNARDLLPGQMNSTVIVNTILKIADDCQVKAIPLITQPWMIESSGDFNYSAFRLNVAATGNFTELVSFVSKLENGELETLIVEDLSVARVTELSGEESAPEENVNASLDLAIYTQSPATDQNEKVH